LASFLAREDGHVTLDTAIGARLGNVLDRIARAAERAGRLPESVRLVAVSKTFAAGHVRAAAEAGQIDFGENKVQEALQKIGETADLRIRWHLVGHLQSNKARKAAQVFGCIHSVDRLDLLERLDAAATEAGTAPELLVQVDLGGEPTKHGAAGDALRALFDRARSCRSTRVVGLMSLPPFSEDPEEARPFFRRLREIRDTLLRDGVPPPMLRDLSIGMSHDFDVAIDEGATIVRVGTAIFGARGA
jgi:pyridoxal phosphate enzyme (YggS family)